MQILYSIPAYLHFVKCEKPKTFNICHISCFKTPQLIQKHKIGRQQACTEKHLMHITIFSQ